MALWFAADRPGRGDRGAGARRVLLTLIQPSRASIAKAPGAPDVSRLPAPRRARKRRWTRRIRGRGTAAGHRTAR